MSVPYPPAESPSPQPTDNLLLRNLAAGDRQAGEELVRRSYAMIYRSLLRLCGGQEDLAADLSQETYRRAWAALKDFDGRSRFSTWLYRIAYRCFLNHLRRPRKLVPIGDELARKSAVLTPGPEEQATQNQQEERLRKAVLELPEPLGETITARYWGEISVREIAIADGISEVAVRKRLRKAIALLRKHLEVAS